MSYQEKKEQRIEKLRDRASAARSEAEALQKRTNSERDGIPLGQPILVGHYSEGRHRRHLSRLNASDTRAMELLKKADRLNSRAHAAETNSAISSDDPEAVKLLLEKLLKLEEKRSAMKAYNVRARKERKETLESWELSNLGAQIRSVKERIKQLQNMAQMVDDEKEINGVRVVTSTDENRLQLFFDGKPAVELRQELKSNGFKWSSSRGCWQRMISNSANAAAERILSTIKK
jgi:uncharacterized protein YdcH (DUF465 family)